MREYGAVGSYGEVIPFGTTRLKITSGKNPVMVSEVEPCPQPPWLAWYTLLPKAFLRKTTLSVTGIGKEVQQRANDSLPSLFSLYPSTMPAVIPFDVLSVVLLLFRSGRLSPEV